MLLQSCNVALRKTWSDLFLGTLQRITAFFNVVIYKAGSSNHFNSIPGHTTRKPLVGLEKATNCQCIQFYVIANLDKTSLKSKESPELCQKALVENLYYYVLLRIRTIIRSVLLHIFLSINNNIIIM